MCFDLSLGHVQCFPKARVFKDVGIPKKRISCCWAFSSKGCYHDPQNLRAPHPIALLLQEIRPYYGIIKGHKGDGIGGVWVSPLKTPKTTQVKRRAKESGNFFGELPENLPISTGQKIRFFSMFCFLMAVKCLDFFSFFESQMMGSCLVSIHLTKKIYHQPQVSRVSYIHFSVPLTISQRDEMMQLWIPSESKRQEKTLDLHVPWQTLLAQLLYHQHPGSKISIPTTFFISFFGSRMGSKEETTAFQTGVLFASFRSLMSHGGIHAGYVGESDENSSDVKLVEPSFRCRRNSLLTSKGRCVSLGLFFFGHPPPKKSLPKLNFLLQRCI